MTTDVAPTIGKVYDYELHVEEDVSNGNGCIIHFEGANYVQAEEYNDSVLGMVGWSTSLKADEALRAMRKILPDAVKGYVWVLDEFDPELAEGAQVEDDDEDVVYDLTLDDAQGMLYDLEVEETVSRVEGGPEQIATFGLANAETDFRWYSPTKPWKHTDESTAEIGTILTATNLPGIRLLIEATATEDVRAASEQALADFALKIPLLQQA